MQSDQSSLRGKRIVVVENDAIARDPNPERATSIHRMRLRVGKEWGEDYHPGQFVMLRVDDRGERIPFTVADYDPGDGVLTLVYQAVGATTRAMAAVPPGGHLEDVTFPLGRGIDLTPPDPTRDIALIVGGGIGVVPSHAKAKALAAAGYRVVSLIGARTAGLLVLLDAVRKVSDACYVTTDDGSYDGPGAAFVGESSGAMADDAARRALRVTDLLEAVIASAQDDTSGPGAARMPLFNDLYPTGRIARIYLAGPDAMMTAASEITRGLGVPTFASLNSVMVDGSGMCGGCKVTLRGDGGARAAFTCTDGPVFDAHALDWAEVRARGVQYQVQVDAVEAAAHAVPDAANDTKDTRFEHVAGYISLEAAIEATDRCVCKIAEGRVRLCTTGCPLGINVQMFMRPLKPAAMIERLWPDGTPDGEDARDLLEGVVWRAQTDPDACAPDELEGVDHAIFEAFEALSEHNPIPEITGLVCPQERQCENPSAGCVRARQGEPIDGGRSRDRRPRGVPLRNAARAGRRAGIRHPGVPPAERDRAHHGAGRHGRGESPYSGCPRAHAASRLPGRVRRHRRWHAKISRRPRREPDRRLYSERIPRPRELHEGIPLPRAHHTRASRRGQARRGFWWREHGDGLRSMRVADGGGERDDHVSSIGGRDTRAARRASGRPEGGVLFQYLVTPYELLGEDGRLREVGYYDNVLGEPDADGRRRPDEDGRRRPGAVTDCPRLAPADIAIIAIGQDPNPTLDTSAYDLDRSGRIIVDDDTLETNVASVYAGGDAVAGTGGTVIFAAGCGLRAARAIHARLSG